MTKDTIEIKIFFADTYALIELLRGNSSYRPYLDCMLVISKFNLVELYYHLLCDKGKEIADKELKVYSKLEIPITYGCIRKGMEFKLKHKKEKLSYVDCIGYALALELGIKFLSGDQKFEDKDNVEFVK
ncbi:MAG: PIN domain-containing protein [Nanoarchaeota archaeon]